MSETFSLLYPKGLPVDKINNAKVSEAFSELQIGSLLDIGGGNSRSSKGSNSDVSQYFTLDTEVIKYRLDIIEDLLNNPSVYNAFKEALTQIKEIVEFRESLASVSDILASLYSVLEIQKYIKCIDSLYEGMGKSTQLKSKGLKQFSEIVNKIYGSNDFNNLKSELKELADNVGSIKSVTIGVNLDPQLRTIEAGVVSINNQPFRSGNIIDRLLRLDIKDDGFRCITPLVPYGNKTSGKDADAFNTAMNNALDTILHSSAKTWHPTVKEYISTNTDFIVLLADDIRFLLAGAEFARKLEKLEQAVCKPQIRPAEEKAFSVNGIYNPHHVLESSDLPENSAAAITRALFQLGVYVPAISAEISPVETLETIMNEV